MRMEPSRVARVLALTLGVGNWWRVGRVPSRCGQRTVNAEYDR